MLCVKGNQLYLSDDCERWIEDAVAGGTADTFETAERGHGRDEHRRYWSVAVPSGAFRPTLWAGLTSVGMVEARRHVGGKTSVEQRCFATSLPVGAETLARAVRGHWGIENGLHWTLDVAFREDESRTREAHAAANLSVVRRVSATLLKAEPSGKGGVQTRRMRAAWDGAYRGRVLGLQ